MTRPQSALKGTTGVASESLSFPKGGRFEDSLDAAVLAFEQEWRRGHRPSIEAHWARSGEPGGSITILSALIKADLRARFERGERPSVTEYLERFPQLQATGDRVVSLVYEEYCLLEDCGEAPHPDRFCERYEPWRDSLVSQLQYHKLLSQAVTPSAKPDYPAPGYFFAEKYRLRSVLGEGGAARVYLAEYDELGGREVALKVSPNRGKEPSIQGRLDHQYIVPVWTVDDDPSTGLRGLCMPYQVGLPLDQVIRRVDPKRCPRDARVFWECLRADDSPASGDNLSLGWYRFPIRGTYTEGAAWIALNMARALAYAHGRKVLHRDVKPANVLLTVRDGPKLLDFNLAHDPNAADQAEAALRGGTLPYMAPEQLGAFLDPKKWDSVGPSADIFSLGLLLYELLTGQRPESPDPNLLWSQAISDLLDRRLEGLPSPRLFNPDIPYGMAAIVQRCLAYDPKDRYQSADDLADDLQRFLDRRPLRHAVNPSKREIIGNWLRRNRVAIAGTLLVGSAVLATPMILRAIFDPAMLVKAANDRTNNGELDWARWHYQFALWLNPRLYTAYQGLAHIEDAQENFAASYDLYTQAYEVSRTSNPYVGDIKVAMVLRDRALVSNRWAAQIQSKPTPESLAQARPHYLSALKDLEEARRLWQGIGEEDEIKLLLAASKAELGVGDFASIYEDYRSSLDRYEKALSLAERSLYLARGLQANSPWHLAHAAATIGSLGLTQLWADYGLSGAYVKHSRMILDQIASRLEQDYAKRARDRELSASTNP